VLTFSFFVVLVLAAMVAFSTYGVNHLLQNLVAIKFILNFIPGKMLLANKKEFNLKDLDI